jgi:serine/threonine protein phosphatase PrpC
MFVVCKNLTFLQLWDVIEDQRAVDFVLENASNDAALISKKLLALALKEGSTDNLTVVVVKL